MHVYACFSTCLLLEGNISLCFLSLVQNLISAIALRLPKSNCLLPNQLLQCLAVATDQPEESAVELYANGLFPLKKIKRFCSLLVQKWGFGEGLLKNRQTQKPLKCLLAQFGQEPDAYNRTSLAFHLHSHLDQEFQTGPRKCQAEHSRRWLVLAKKYVLSYALRLFNKILFCVWKTHNKVFRIFLVVALYLMPNTKSDLPD